MRLLRSLLRPLDGRIRTHVVEHVEHHVETYVSQHVVDVMGPKLDRVSGQVEDVRRVTVEVQRLTTDDLDASNEVAAVLGRALRELTGSVEALREEIAELRGRLDGAT